VRLAQVEITDFQSIKYLLLETADLTFMIGESNAGKSAILRAITQVFTLPKGDYFVRDGAQFCKVVLVFRVEDGTTIILTYQKPRKTSAIFKMTIGDQEQVWQACQTLPAEVKAAVGMAGLELTEGRTLQLNLTTQHDGPFLLTDTHLAAKVIGHMSSMDRIANALRNVNSDTKRARTELSVHQENEKSLATKLKKYEGVALLVEVIVAMGELETGILDHQDTLAKLDLTKLDRAETKVALIDSLDIGTSSTRVRNGREALTMDFQSLDHRMELLEKVEVKTTIHEQLKVISAPSVTTKDMQALKETFVTLDVLGVRLSEVAEKRDRTTRELDTAREEKKIVSDRLEELSSVIKVCPTCKQVLNVQPV